MAFSSGWRIIAALLIAGAVQGPANGSFAIPAVPETVQDGASQTAQNEGSWILYRNKQYGFCFSLPASWRGYSVVKQQWRGGPPGSGSDHRGPKILIRHPKWTAVEPYEDIPIMIFSLSEWRFVEKEEWVVSTAPFPPTELARNGHYVFALPPRYNYDFAKGYEEVDRLVKGKRLRTTCGKEESRAN